MNRMKLALFALDQVSAMAIDLAGAHWMGGDVRHQRAMARAKLYDEAMDALLSDTPFRRQRVQTSPRQD